MHTAFATRRSDTQSMNLRLLRLSSIVVLLALGVVAVTTMSSGPGLAVVVVCLVLAVGLLGYKGASFRR